MANTGFWVVGIPLTSVNMRWCLTQQGIAADLPAAKFQGRLYFETDTYKLKRDTGAAWEIVLDVDLAAGSASLRTLGSTSTTAAAGNHTH